MSKKKTTNSPAAAGEIQDANARQRSLVSLIQDCETIRNEVNTYLGQKGKAKVNTLSKCNDCPIEHEDWVVVNSPFDAPLLNTGHNGAGGFIPSGSGTDLHWEAGLGDTSGPASVSSWIPAFVFRDTAWASSPYANANWISLYHDASHSDDLDIYFRIRFYLNSSVNPSQFFLDMRFYADNSVHEIYVNGIPQGANYPGVLPQTSSDPYNYRGFDSGKEVLVSLAHDWQACENEIIVHVKSGSPKIGFLAQNASKCYEAPLPELSPEIKITWGDSDCDCMETDDFESLCISVCNPYSNVSFNNLSIGRISIVDESGNPVPVLPDGTLSVEVLPVGPHCFGNIGPCVDDNDPAARDNCITREFVIRTRGAVEGKYKLLLEGICFEICNHFGTEGCFELHLCKD